MLFPQISGLSLKKGGLLATIVIGALITVSVSVVSLRRIWQAISEQRVPDANFVSEKTQRHPSDQDRAEQKVELTERSRQFLENVSGILKSKRVLEATAKEVLPHKWMELHPSFIKDKDELVQKNLQGEAVQTLDELLAVALIAKPVFDAALETIVRASGLDPERTITDKNGKIVMLDNSRAFTVLTLAPLKSTVRLVEKVSKELEGDFSKVVDVVRCSVVVFTEAQLENVAQLLNRQSIQQKGNNHSSSTSSRGDENSQPQGQRVHEVVRFKNRFKDPLFNGYRDALYNIVVHCGNGVTHVCEVQLHLADIVAQMEGTHMYYEYFRTYFGGSRAEASRMAALEKIDDGACDGRNVDQMIGSVLNGHNLEQLHHLAYLIEGLMGDVKIALLVRKRILELDENNFSSQISYGTALFETGQLSEAEAVLDRVLSHERQLLGNAHVDTFRSINTLAALLQKQGKLVKAGFLYREALNGRRQRLGSLHPDTLTSINNLGTLLQEQGQLSEAESMYRAALDGRRQVLGNSHPDTLSSINNLASLLVTQDQGKLTEAESLYRATLDQRTKLLGHVHPDTFRSINNLAVLLQKQGKLTEAEAFYRDALDGRRQLLGNSHPDTLSSMNNLAVCLQDQGKQKLVEAERFCREALGGRRQLLGDLHPDTLSSMNNLASLLQQQGKLFEAECLCREALNGRMQALGSSHPDTLSSINDLAFFLQKQGKLFEAEPFSRAALEGRRQLLGNLHPDTLSSINNLAVLLKDQGKLIEAEPLYWESLSGGRQLGNSHPFTLLSINNFASLLTVQGLLSEAESLFWEALEGSRQLLGNSHPDTLSSMNNLVTLLETKGIWDQKGHFC